MKNKRRPDPYTGPFDNDEMRLRAANDPYDGEVVRRYMVLNEGPPHGRGRARCRGGPHPWRPHSRQPGQAAGDTTLLT